MKLYHATTRKVLPSILANGLLSRMAKGKRKATWFVSQRQIPWAVLHVCNKRKVAPDQVVLLECDVARREAKRFATSGLWYAGDVPPARIRVAGGYQLVTL